MKLTRSAGKPAGKRELVLLLIGWKSGASFLSQSCSVRSWCKTNYISTLVWTPLYCHMTHYCLTTLTSKLITSSPSNTIGTLTKWRAIWRDRIRAVGRSLGHTDHFYIRRRKHLLRQSYKERFGFKVLRDLTPFSVLACERTLLAALRVGRAV